VKIALWALLLAALWTAVLITVASTIGLRTTPGMWTGAIGLPGVVIANWIQRRVLHLFFRPLGYALMFAINWLFYCSVLQGLASLKRAVTVRAD